MSDIKFVTKKKVTVTCNTPFRIGKIPYSGICRNIILTVQDISECLTNHARVVEILSNGQEVPINFSNYDTYNGPTDVTDDSEALVEKPADPEIEQKNNQGETIKTFNKVEEKEKKPENKVIQVTTNVNKTTEVNADTKSTVEVTAEVKSDTNEQIKTEADNSNDTKVEVENKQQHNNNNNFQQNQKKNKFK